MGIPFEVMESRKDLKGIQWLTEHGYKCTSEFNVDALEKISKVYVSPGISKNNPILRQANFLNIEIETDIDIFFEIF